MSARTSITEAANATGFPEDGAVLDSSGSAADASDPTNGNKFTRTRTSQLFAWNASGASKTLTFTWSHRGGTITRVVTLGAAEKRLMGPFPEGMAQHDGDADVAQIWLTASGSAGDVKLRALPNTATT